MTAVAAQSKAWVFCRALVGTASTNPARDMDICLWCVLCVQVEVYVTG
jgi:hypothetical protein